MDIFWTILIVASFFGAFITAFRPGADDASWDLHWRALDVAGRARMVTAANSREARAELPTPEDLALVAGYSRHKRRRRAHVDLAATSVLVVASALALAGLLGSGELGLLASLFLVAASTWEYLSEKQIGRRLRAVVDAESPAAR